MAESTENKGIYLLSIDLEDVRMGIPDGEKYKERVPYLIEKYLELFYKNNLKITFFVVGLVAEKYPSLIKMIFDEGHEIACHSFEHRYPIDKTTKELFRTDLIKNIEVLLKTGVKNVIGYRAPSYSLVEKTSWAYEIIDELGLKYSSSVLPAKNPLYGWKEFGCKPKKIGNVLEIPLSITNSKLVNIPFGGGIYFRVIPQLFLSHFFKKSSKEGKPIIGYLHPYDIDTEQEKFMHPGINNNKIYHHLMYYGRAGVFNKIQKIIDYGFRVIKYDEYYNNIISQIR